MRRTEDYPLSEILGPEWDGVVIRAGRYLVLPGWRAGFEPAELRALFFTSQEARALRHELARARCELEAAIEACDAAESRAAWYRAQLVTESKLGLALGLT